MRKTMMAAACMIALCAPVRAEYVTAKAGLCVRSEPSTDAQVVAVLPFGTEVQGKTRGEWIELSEGFLKAEFTGPDNPLEDYEPLGSWLTTAYTHTGQCCSDGSYPEAGYTVATNSLPMGTELYIVGVGFRTVCDRGPSSMPDAWLDIFMDSEGECIAWGEQYHDVYVVKEP